MLYTAPTMGEMHPEDRSIVNAKIALSIPRRRLTHLVKWRDTSATAAKTEVVKQRVKDRDKRNKDIGKG